MRLVSLQARVCDGKEESTSPLWHGNPDPHPHGQTTRTHPLHTQHPTLNALGTQGYPNQAATGALSTPPRQLTINQTRSFSFPIPSQP